MASFSYLLRGDNLPTVGVLQLLLNRSGAGLKVDGNFGQRTEEAVMRFQAQRRLQDDGIVHKATWERLLFRDQWQILDVVDVFHDMIYDLKRMEIIQSGGDTLDYGGMSNALSQLGEDLRSVRGLGLLRMTGHGAAGIQALSMGLGGYHGTKKDGTPGVIWYPHQTTSLNARNIATIPAAALRASFGAYGSMELHGCHVANGPKGHMFVRDLANRIGVPVTAGVDSQRTALHFDGQTFTAIPRGGTLASWCHGLKPFTPVSVP